MRRVHRAAALGLALTLVCLSAAPVAAAPRTEEPPAGPVLVFQGFVEHVADFFFGDSIRMIFGEGGCAGDPNGGPSCASDDVVALGGDFSVEREGESTSETAR